MRTEDEMMQQVYNVAKKIDVVKAIAMNGSRVYRNEESKMDEFQDFDIVYFVPDDAMQNLIDHHEWIDNFGERLILQTPMDMTPKPIDYTKRFNFLMLFRDGSRLDLGLVPLSEADTWAKKDPIAKVLIDNDGILAKFDLQNDDSKYFRKKPSQGAFMRHCNEFWWTIPYVVKGIKRNQFFYAADHYYENVFGEFLVIIEWSTAGQHDFKINLGKNLSNLLNFVEPEAAAEIQSLANFDTYEKMSKNIVKMMAMFDRLAKKFASDFDYEYNEEEARNIMRYTKEELVEYLK